MTYALLQQAFAANGGVFNFGFTPASTATTAATATSGFFSFQVLGERTGSTWPNTIQSIGGSQTPATGTLLHIQATNSAGRGGGMARIYRVGTLNLTATGNGFTHDAATLPLLRDELGQSNIPQAFIPFIKVTTALSGTAAAIRLQTSTGTAGYVDEQGNPTIGTRTFTFPSATTAVGSCFFLPLNDVTYACRDITQIRVDAASTTGACEVYLLEGLAISQSLFAGASTFDAITGGGLDISTNEPAAATSGVITSYLVTTNYSAAAVTQTIINVAL